MPRLTKGQVGIGIRRRSEAAKASAIARIKLFSRLCAMPGEDGEPPDKKQIERFANLSALASWNDIEGGITPLAAKTLRKHLDENYCGGYALMKAKAKDYAAKVCRSGRDAKKSPESDNERRSRFAADAVMEMTTRYLDALERLRRLAGMSDAARTELLRHLTRYGDDAGVLRVVC